MTTNDKLTKSDLVELERQHFESSLDDLAALKSELGLEFSDAVTKSVIITAIAGVGAIAATIFPEVAPIINGVVTASGAPVTVGGAMTARNKFVKARAEILRKHPMAFLYELQN